LCCASSHRRSTNFRFSGDNQMGRHVNPADQEVAMNS
jgi:hypothetical protein